MLLLRWGLVGIALGLAWSSPLTARAESVDAARERFEEGMAAAEAGDDLAAIEALTESYELSPRPVTLLNLAIFQDRAGRRPDAYRSFSELLSQYGSEISDETRARVTERVEALEDELARVEVETDPTGAMVLVDGEERGRSPLVLVLEPGRYRFEARLDDREPVSSSRQVRAGEVLRVDLSLPGRPSTPTPTPTEPSPGGFWHGPWPWVIGSVVLAGILAVVLGVTLTDEEPVPDWTLRVP